MKRVSPAEAWKLVDEGGYAIVDVRTEAEYAAGHPKGAVNVPVATAGARGMEPNPRFVEVMSRAFAKDAKLVLTCRSGGRSLRAAGMLEEAGFTNLVDQRAGWDGVRDAFGQLTEPGWSPAGLPAETSTPDGGYAEVLAKAGA